MGHFSDGSVVGDERSGGAELAIDALNHVQHQHPGLRIERPGWLVAQQNGGPLGDGACDGNPLLLTARKLRWKVVEAVAQAHQRECLFGLERVIGDVGDQRDVLAGRQARNQVVELKDETNVRVRELLRFEEDPPRARHVQATQNVE